MLLQYLRTREAAHFLGIAEKTLHNWRARGQGPAFVRIGSRAVAYSLDELQRFASASSATQNAASSAAPTAFREGA